MERVKISVDRSLCVGSGQCVFEAERIFDQSEDDGIVILRDPTPPAALTEDAKRAERLCPSRAISIEVL